MEYVIVTIEWCENKGLLIPALARRSLDGNKVILHKDFIKPVLTELDDLTTYSHNSQELSEILSNSEWSIQEEL